MARITKPLTETEIRLAKPGAKSRKLFDGGGLFLLVSPKGKKGWRFKYRFHGKEKLISFGTYPEVSLAEARSKRQWARQILETNEDPSLVRKVEKLEKQESQAHTFKVLAKEWYDKQGHLSARTREMIWRRLEQDVFPAIGYLPATDLTPRMILEGVLRPMERRGAIELAHRSRSVVSRILRYGVAIGLLERDVSSDLRGALPAIARKHMAAPTDPKMVGAILRAIDGFEGTFVVKMALRLHPLVATRPGELRHMEWNEVDLESGTWEIPAGKMKMKNAHIVPLSRQAVEILQAVSALTGTGRYVFPSMRSNERPISDNTLNAALRRLGIEKDELTSHGWRAVFRTLADEVLQERVDFIEQQLAHQVADSLGRAYNRTQFLKERREMMQRWANYLDGLKSGAKVIALKRQA